MYCAGEPLSSPFLEPRTERPFLQRCSWVTPNCSQLLLVLNTYQSSWNFLRSYQVQQQQGRPLWRTRFGRVFRSGNWARQIGQKLNYSAKKSAGRAQPPPEAHWVIQLIFVFRAMLSLGLAREGLVCLRENLRTQGLRFQERVRQGNFRYARGVVLKVSGRCVHLGWQIASETKKAKCLVQAPGRTLEAVSWLKIYSKKRPSQLQCSRANLARVPSKVPVWICDLYFYDCE